MKNFILGLLLGSLISVAYADRISSPPPLVGEPPAEQAYLREIYENIDRFEIVTSAPDGTRKGRKGQGILYNNSGIFTLWINVDSATDWQQI